MAEDKKKRNVSKPKDPPKTQTLGNESLVDRLLPHIKKIVVATVIIAVGTMAFFGYRACNRKSEVKKTVKVAAVLDVAMTPIDPTAGSGSGSGAGSGSGFPSAKARAERVLDEMAKQDTEATGPAFKASMLIDAGKLDEAITVYQGCQQGAGIENVLCREGLGIALETKASSEKDATAQHKLLEQALDAFLRMQPAEDGPRHAYAIYHQARINLLLGKKAEAKALFEKVKAMSPPRELSQLVERRLASLGAS